MPSSLPQTTTILVIILAIAFVGFMWFLQEARGRAMLQSWANDNGLELTEVNSRYLLRGPFFWTTSKNQLVYRITVRTREGQLYNGWARCGSWWWGILADKVEARWDDQTPPPLTYTPWEES